MAWAAAVLVFIAVFALVYWALTRLLTGWERIREQEGR